MSQERLNDSDVGPAFEQVGRKAVTQRVECHGLLDAGRLGCLMEQAVQWRVVIGLPRLLPGNSQRSSIGVPASDRVGRAFHHWRSRSSVSADG